MEIGGCQMVMMFSFRAGMAGSKEAVMSKRIVVGRLSDVEREVQAARL